MFRSPFLQSSSLCGAVLSLLGVLAAMPALAQSKGQTLYVSDFLAGDIARFSLDAAPGTPPQTFAVEPQGPEGLAFNASGILFVANSMGDSIEEYNQDGAHVGTFAANLSSRPTSLVFDKSGNLYVGGIGTTVTEYGAAGDVLRTIDFSSTGFGNTNGIALGSDGTLYATAFNSGRIDKLSPSASTPSVFADTNSATPVRLALNSAGNVFVSYRNEGQVEEFSPTGQDLGTFASGFYQPRGLAFDTQGNLYVANGSSAVEEFAPNKSPIGIFAGLFQSEDLAFGPSSAPVPETSSVISFGLLLILGFGAVAVVHVRRKKPRRHESAASAGM